MKVLTAGLNSVFSGFPSLEQIQEQEANCRFELNKEHPRHTIIGISTRSIKNKDKTVTLFVDITFFSHGKKESKKGK